MSIDQKYITSLHDWAVSKPEIAKLWIFGSRAKGTQRADSDIDIGFLINPIQDSTSQSKFREITMSEWIIELSQLVPWPIHLEPAILETRTYIEECSILVFSRE
ncbi:nucleotidyltransferase family protein [Methylophilus sp. 3sh_L]|uniref:nucleotidyltransferase family protein n=1 Tax=Methylophilus sp. 3sh_L TaxID=3377114 RepID=UPI00398EC967